MNFNKPTNIHPHDFIHHNEQETIMALLDPDSTLSLETAEKLAKGLKDANTGNFVDSTTARSKTVQDFINKGLTEAREGRLIDLQSDGEYESFKELDDDYFNRSEEYIDGEKGDFEDDDDDEAKVTGTLSFNVETSEGREKFLRAMTADDAYNILWTIQNQILRSALKYDLPENIKTPYDAIEYISDKINDELNASDVNLNWYN